MGALPQADQAHDGCGARASDARVAARAAVRRGNRRVTPSRPVLQPPPLPYPRGLVRQAMQQQTDRDAAVQEKLAQARTHPPTRPPAHTPTRARAQNHHRRGADGGDERAAALEDPHAAGRPREGVAAPPPARCIEAPPVATQRAPLHRGATARSSGSATLQRRPAGRRRQWESPRAAAQALKRADEQRAAAEASQRREEADKTAFGFLREKLVRPAWPHGQRLVFMRFGASHRWYGCGSFLTLSRACALSSHTRMHART
jgi:hypothetical protein